MKILYVTTISSTFHFFDSIISRLIESDNIVEIATNANIGNMPNYVKEKGLKVHTIDCCRSPFSKSNIKAISQIKKICESGNYDIVHCHTPIAGFCARLACKKLRKSGTKVIYTAHGFHFFKGAPVKNWLIFYPLEWLTSFFTDYLITINHEDYEFAKNHLYAKHIKYVPGVGVDINKFANAVCCKEKYLLEFNIPDDSIVFLSVGELNHNKNHESVIRAIANIGDDRIHYIIIGEGNLRENLIDTAKRYNIKDRVHLIGRRNDVPQLLKFCDYYIHPSYREGLPVSPLEAIASGCCVLGSDIRGNRDLLLNSLLFKHENIDRKIKELLNRKLSNDEINHYNYVIEKYSICNVNKMLISLYGDVAKNN